jgi:hypothetical protein
MQTVNRYMLRDLLNPIGGTADINEEILRYRYFDNNSQTAVNKILREKLLPYYEKASSQYKTSYKRSLSYFLSAENFDFGDLYDSCLIAFDHPVNPRDFFLWIWQVLFPAENYENGNNKDFTEIDDPQEPYRYWTEE